MTESKQLRWHRIDVASFAAAKKTRFFNPRQKKLTLTLTQQQKEQHENLSLQLCLMCYCCGESRYRQAYNSVTYYTGPHLNLILSKLNLCIKPKVNKNDNKQKTPFILPPQIIYNNSSFQKSGPTEPNWSQLSNLCWPA